MNDLEKIFSSFAFSQIMVNPLSSSSYMRTNKRKKCCFGAPFDTITMHSPKKLSYNTHFRR